MHDEYNGFVIVDGAPLTFAEWRALYMSVRVQHVDGLLIVYERRVGSPARSALWHLTDFRIVGVSTDGVVLQKRQ